MTNGDAPVDPVEEKDKPFILAVLATAAWIAGTFYAAFVQKDLETTKFVAATLGPAAFMGLGFYLRGKAGE